MKKRLVVFIASCVAMLGAANLASAQSPEYAENAAKIEETLFAKPVQNVVDFSDANAVKQFITELEDEDEDSDSAKCYWSGYCCYYPARPVYCYYGWYCPIYACNFRMVCYTIPRTVVVRTVRVQPTVTQVVLKPRVIKRTITTEVVEPTTTRVVRHYTTTEQVASTTTTTSSTTQDVDEAIDEATESNDAADTDEVADETAETDEASETETDDSEYLVVTNSKGARLARGAAVSGPVGRNSILAKKGIRQGDVIVSVDGSPVNDLSDLKKITRESKIKYVKGNALKIASKAIPAGRARLSSSNVKSDVTVGVMPNDKIEGAGMTLYEFFNTQE